MQTKKNSAKKALLKKIMKGKKIGKTPTGASPLPMSNGLGNIPVSGGDIGGGGGSNLGTNGIF